MALRSTANAVTNNVLHFFFKEYGHFGEERVPSEGPVIFVCGPHQNQFFDPMIVQQACTTRNIRWITAAKTMRRKFVGGIARIFDSIPCERPQDKKKKGTTACGAV